MCAKVVGAGASGETLSPPPLLQKLCPLGARLCPRFAPARPSLRSGQSLAPSGLINLLPLTDAPNMSEGGYAWSSPPSSAGGFPEPPPACGCGGYRYPLPLPFLLLHALPCSAPCGRMAELSRHSRGPPSPLGSGGRGPPSPLFPLPAPKGAERCPAIKAGLF